MFAVCFNEISQVYTLTLQGEPIACTSHKELATAIQLAATPAVDVAEARSSALLAVLEGVPAQGMPRVAVYTNDTDQVTLSFTGAGDLIEVRLPSSDLPEEIRENLALVALDSDTRVFTATQPLPALPAVVDLNNTTAVVDGVLPALQQRGTVLEIEGENKLVFLPEDSTKARATRVEDGHLWIESPVPGYWEHASLV